MSGAGGGAAPGTAGHSADAFAHWQRNMWLLWLCNLFSNIGFTLYFPFIPLIVQELGAGAEIERWTGYYSVVLYATTMALMPVWGGLADHFGKRSMMLRASMGQLAGFSLMAFAPNLAVLMALVAWIGAANGFNASSQALVATNTPPASLGRALSTVQSGALLGSTLGPVLGGVLAVALPAYRLLYLVGSSLSVGTSLIVWLGVRETHTRPAEPFRLHLLADLGQCLRVPTMGLLFYLMFLFASTFFGSTTIVSLYTLSLLGGAEAWLGLSRDLWLSLVTVALTVSSVAALPVWGRLLDRYETGRVAGVSLGLCLLALLPFPLVGDPLQLTLARLVLGLGAVGLQPALLRLLKDAAPAGMEARALAFGTSLYMAGHGVAPFMAGELAPWIGLRGYFVVHTGLIASGLALWVLLGVRRAGR